MEFIVHGEGKMFAGVGGHVMQNFMLFSVGTIFILCSNEVFFYIVIY